MVAALFVVVYAVANPFAAFGVFLPVLADTFGWSRGAISIAMSINLVLGGFLGFVIGAIADRHGPRAPLMGTVALAGAGFALASTVQALWHLYVFIGLMVGVGLSSFYVIATATVSRWFTSGRGLAIGIVLTGFNVGFMTGGPAAAFLIERIGWRAAWVVLGAGFGLLATLASAVVRYPPGSLATPTGSRWTGLAALLGDSRMWALNASWLVGGFVLTMLSVHIVPFARDQGLPLEVAALALGAYGFGSIGGRLGGGVTADRFGVRSLVWVWCGLEVIALTGLLFRPSPAMLLGLLAVFGLGFAGADTLVARAVPEIFGLRAIGAAFGVLSLGWRLGAALGPVVAGFVYDRTGSYAIPFGAAPVAVLASFVLFLAAVRTKRPGGPLP